MKSREELIAQVLILVRIIVGNVIKFFKTNSLKASIITQKQKFVHVFFTFVMIYQLNSCSKSNVETV